mmetsp:Transcript_85831/g.179335  ORF Transcript_85831/g.179335 Transcript_85831/m.179335 type:complete len:253 (+) Transcript_85831:1836-2594(+)
MALHRRRRRRWRLGSHPKHRCAERLAPKANACGTPGWNRKRRWEVSDRRRSGRRRDERRKIVRCDAHSAVIQGCVRRIRRSLEVRSRPSREVPGRRQEGTQHVHLGVLPWYLRGVGYPPEADDISLESQRLLACDSEPLRGPPVGTSGCKLPGLSESPSNQRRRRLEKLETILGDSGLPGSGMHGFQSISTPSAHLGWSMRVESFKAWSLWNASNLFRQFCLMMMMMMVMVMMLSQLLVMLLKMPSCVKSRL